MNTPADKPNLPEGTPERIYLQISNDDADELPAMRFQDLEGVTWCEDQIGSVDPEYIRADVVQRLLADERRKALAALMRQIAARAIGGAILVDDIRALIDKEPT